MNSFCLNRLFMDDLSCPLVVCKKYTNTNGKDSKYTNTMYINITETCGGGVVSAGGRGVGDVVSAGSFIACIVSISTTFFSSFKILSFNLFM